MSLSILARGERLRERLLSDVADLRITGFQSPAEDEREEGLSLDRLTGLGAPHIWGVRVLDDTLLGFGIFPGDRLIVNRAACQLDNRFVVVDLGGGRLSSSPCLARPLWWPLAQGRRPRSP